MARKPKQLDPSRLPGRHRSRVFIGGSYRSDMRSILGRLEQAVRDAGFQPIIADKYWLENPDDIHSVTMSLLHSCRLAIFEMSTASGALMEIERLPDYGTHALVLYQDPDNKAWMISRMLETFVKEHQHSIEAFPYDGVAAAVSRVAAWLDVKKAEGFG